MNQDQLIKLKGYYHSLLEQQQAIADTHRSDTVDRGAVAVLVDELSRLCKEFPGLVPEIDMEQFHIGSTAYYRGVRAHLGRVIGRLKVEIETTDSSPVVETKEFPFVKDHELRKLLERDYKEIRAANVSHCWKSVVILAGGSIEAILTDILLQREATAKGATKAPKGKEISEWGFLHLILVCAELSLINPGVEKLSHSIREYRDLVHPSAEIRSKLKADMEEARIALEVLNMLHRDLSR